MGMAEVDVVLLRVHHQERSADCVTLISEGWQLCNDSELSRTQPEGEEAPPYLRLPPDLHHHAVQRLDRYETVLGVPLRLVPRCRS